MNNFNRDNTRQRTGDRFDNTPKGDAKSSIIDLADGDYFSGTVKILRKTKPGPVIFTVSDGEAMVDAVIKDSGYAPGDIVNISGTVNRRARMQIEISHIERSDADFSTIFEQKSRPKRTQFSIRSQRYGVMKERFLEIAQAIRQAIFENRPIVIRHHSDSDGINSGLLIEQSILGLMEKTGVDPKYNLYRSPSKAPFYEITDVFKDITLFKRITDEHKQPAPLLIMLDNGSTPEDAFGMKSMKMLGYDVIVVDHHNPVIVENGRTSVCPYLKLHLNPYMFGLDSKTSAGMLCYELARFINEDYDNKLMPAVAALSDRCDIPETDEYVKNSGKSVEYLKQLGVAIDFVAFHMKFDAGEGLFEALYTNEDLVRMINSEVTKGVETQLQSTLPYLKTQNINGIVFSHIDLEKYTLRFTYPAPGKVLGLIHDHVATGKESMPVLTIGYVSDMIIVRATHPVLPVHKMLDVIKKELPEANVDGGGHEMAGTLKFVPAHLTTIIEKIKDELKKVNIAETLHPKE